MIVRLFIARVNSGTAYGNKCFGSKFQRYQLTKYPSNRNADNPFVEMCIWHDEPLFFPKNFSNNKPQEHYYAISKNYCGKET